MRVLLLGILLILPAFSQPKVKQPCRDGVTTNCTPQAGADGSVPIGTTLPAGAPSGSVAVGGIYYGSAIGSDAGLGGDVCFIGDSITADGSGTYYDSIAGSFYLGSGWTTQLPLLSSQAFYASSAMRNFGIPGNTTAQMLARIADVITQPCRRVFVLGGTNDIPSIAPAQIGANLLSIYNYLRANGKQPIACTIPPKIGAVAAAQQANVVIRSIARQYRIPLVDFYGVLATTSGVYAAAAASPDGVHPGTAGHRLMAQQIITQLGSSFPPATVWLPTTTTDGINLVANPLMGTCTSGVPASWNGGYGTASAPVSACVTDAAIAGQWFQNTFTVTTGSTGYYSISAAGAIANTWTAGDTLLFVGRLQATGLEATGSTLDIKATGTGTGAWIYNYSADVSNGVFALTFTAPAPSNAISISAVFHYGNLSNASAVVKLAQVGVINLTSLGAQ